MAKPQKRYPIGHAADTVLRISRARQEYNTQITAAKTSVNKLESSLTYLQSPEKLQNLAAVGETTIDALKPTVAKLETDLKQGVNINKALRRNAAQQIPLLRAKLKVVLNAPAITSTDFIGLMKEVGEYIPGSIRHDRHNSQMHCSMSALYCKDNLWLQDVRVTVNTKTKEIIVTALPDTIHAWSGNHRTPITTRFGVWDTGIIKDQLRNAADNLIFTIQNMVGDTNGHMSRGLSWRLSAKNTSYRILIPRVHISPITMTSDCTPRLISCDHPDMVTKYGSGNVPLTPQYADDLISLLDQSAGYSSTVKTVKETLTSILNRYTV